MTSREARLETFVEMVQRKNNHSFDDSQLRKIIAELLLIVDDEDSAQDSIDFYAYWMALVAGREHAKKEEAK